MPSNPKPIPKWRIAPPGPPELPLAAFDCHELLEEVRRRHFPGLAVPVELWFVRMPTLANVSRYGDKAVIQIHSLVNHHGTPREVLQFVLKHEMLHLAVPQREIDGRTVSHPPEFWEREREIAPEAGRVWGWLWVHFGHCFLRDKAAEKIYIRPAWRDCWAKQRLTLEECGRLYERTVPPADLREGI